MPFTKILFELIPLGDYSYSSRFVRYEKDSIGRKKGVDIIELINAADKKANDC